MEARESFTTKRHINRGAGVGRASLTLRGAGARATATVARGHSHDEKLARLGQLELFGPCSTAEIHWLGRVSDFVTLPAGYLLLHEDKEALQFFIVLKGAAVTSSRGVPVGMVGAGDMVGNVALLRKQPSTYTVQAAGEMELLCMAMRSFHAALVVIPSFSTQMLRVMALRPMPHETEPLRHSALLDF